MSAPFFAAIKNRRTYYQLKKESPISNDRIQEIIKETILHSPSSFNSQSTRAVLLLGAEHDKFWEIVREGLKAIVPADAFEATSQKLDGFKAAYGSVLFFTHTPTVAYLQANYAAYADKFPHWAAQTNGIHEHVLWTALEAEGLGANLQHYNPIVNEKVRETWGISADWDLDAQLVFGTSATKEPTLTKDFKPVEGERFLVFGA